MNNELLTDADVRALLIAVGAPATVAIADHARSFELLELDSLARTEIASRIKDRLGVDVEDDLTPETTPEEMQGLVNARLGASATAA